MYTTISYMQIIFNDWYIYNFKTAFMDYVGTLLFPLFFDQSVVCITYLKINLYVNSIL